MPTPGEADETGTGAAAAARAAAAVRDPTRVAAVRATGLLDADREEVFDRLSRLAVRLAGVPAAFLSLVDERRDFYISACGFGEPLATTRELTGPTFCHHALTSPGPLVIPDTAADPIYRHVPTVRTLGVAAYVGVPVTVRGRRVGSFCAIDTRPRAWTAAEVEVLTELAASAERELELRLQRDELEASTHHLQEQQVELEQQAEALQATAAQLEERTEEAEEARRLAETAQARAAGVLEAMADAYFVLDADFRIVAVNAAMERNVGLTRDALRGRSMWEMFPGTVGNVFERAYRRAAEERAESHFTHDYSDGRLALVTDVDVYPGPDGGVAVFWRDVTARVQAEAERERLLEAERQARAEAEAAWAARMASERQFRTLADAIPTLAWTAKPDGHIDWYNARWYEYTGTTPARMEGWGWQSVHDPAELPWVLDRWRAGIATGQPVEMTFPLRGADGRFRPFLTRIVPLRDADGQVLRWFGTNTDVSPERAAREAVEAERGRLRLALDAARMVGWDYDVRTGRVTHAGDMGGVLGTDFDQLDGFTALVHPEDRAQVQATYNAALAAGSDGQYWAEFRIVRPDTHAVRWVEDRGEVTRDADGHPLRFGGVLRDVTERRAAEAERERLYAAERAARTEAEAANQAKGQFLAVMSHELRTPLNAIGGYAELIELGIHGPVTEAQRAALARIQASQRHLLGLIAGVLDYSRVEAGAATYRLADVPVAEAVAEAEALVAPQLRAKGLGYAWSGAAPGLAARADPEKLQQILLNLLGNAIKFTDVRDGVPGRVEVTCTVVACTGGGDGEIACGRVRLHVRDTGVGIAADELERVFEPFVQADQRLTRAHAGVGLGLAISRDLARGMGGDLTVESTPGVGSTFTLILPAA